MSMDILVRRQLIHSLTSFIVVFQFYIYRITHDYMENSTNASSKIYLLSKKPEQSYHKCPRI